MKNIKSVSVRSLCIVILCFLSFVGGIWWGKIDDNIELAGTYGDSVEKYENWISIDDDNRLYYYSEQDELQKKFISTEGSFIEINEQIILLKGGDFDSCLVTFDKDNNLRLYTSNGAWQKFYKVSNLPRYQNNE